MNKSCKLIPIQNYKFHATKIMKEEILALDISFKIYEN